jgi:hypothetical protein
VNNPLNFILFQVGWFACVYPAAHGLEWVGPLVTLGIVALHLVLTPGALRARYARWLAGVALIGWTLDSGFKLLGVTSYPTSDSWLAPVWILSLWLLFALTVHHSLYWLHRFPKVTVLFGLIGGPLAYYSGVRMGATGFAHAPWVSFLGLGIEYAVLTPWLLRAASAAHWAPLRREETQTLPNNS